MASVLPFLLKHWKTIGILLLVGAIFYCGYWLNSTINKVEQLEQANSQLVKQLQAAESNSQILRDELSFREELDKQLAAMRESSDAKFTEIQKANAAALAKANMELQKCLNVSVPVDVFDRLQNSASNKD